MNLLLDKLSRLPVLETVILSGVNLSNSNLASLKKMVNEAPRLRKLNLSGNNGANGFSSESIKEILSALKQQTHIVDLDFGKLNFNNQEVCYREMSDFIL